MLINKFESEYTSETVEEPQTSTLRTNGLPWLCVRWELAGIHTKSEVKVHSVWSTFLIILIYMSGNVLITLSVSGTTCVSLDRFYGRVDGQHQVRVG